MEGRRRDEDGGGADDDYLITMNVLLMWGWVDMCKSSAWSTQSAVALGFNFYDQQSEGTFTFFLQPISTFCIWP